MKIFSLIMLSLSFWSFAQQTGSISGSVTADGQPLPGVAISAESSVLPQSRTTVSNALGAYRLRALPPGEYEVTFTMSGMDTAKRKVFVNLGGNTELDIDMKISQSEQLTVSYELPLVSSSNTELSNVIEAETFNTIPVGEEYRDLIRLIPGVQVSAQSVRGPSAGGSGQDNIYKYDGVDVTLPLFGNLSAETSTHDIDQVSVVRGGAQAVNFNRSGGFTINSVSKSGTNNYKGEILFRTEQADWESDRDNALSIVDREEDQTWTSVNFGGPVLRDRLFFYASYYAPEISGSNVSNVYGSQPNFDSSRDEFFIKLTFNPIQNLTIHASHRDSETENQFVSIGAFDATSTAENGAVEQTISLIEGNYLIGDSGNLSFTVADYDIDTASLPTTVLDFQAPTQVGSTIDINNLVNLGLIRLPTYGDDAALNELYAPFIEQYGWVGPDGTRQGDSFVGFGSLINDQDFARSSWEIGYDHLLVLGNVEHDLHIGFRHEEADESLRRRSNGLGSVRFGSNPDEFLIATFLSGDGRAIESTYESYNFEINDNMTFGKWNVNVGLMFSNDIYWGQGLREEPSNLSGFAPEFGNRYKMYEIDWDKMIQPRIGIVRELRDAETVQFSFGSFNPPASSLPRAAAWDRNILSRTNIATYNSDGVLQDVTPASSSSGKFFQPDMDPRRVDEVMIGYNRTMDSGWTYKIHSRYRRGSNFWEDTNNTARVAFGATSTDPNFTADEISSLGEYIPELGDFRNEIGGSSYVIAELDNAFTKYYEVTLDAEKRARNWYFKGTYTWSHYYGNFDQDNTSDNNDLNIFIGSSFFADGAGRNVWDYRYGNLVGDRRHMVKLYGNYEANWGTRFGFFAFTQSGEPWEAHSWEPYVDFLPSWDRDDTSRYAEPAGSRRSPSHSQLDINATHRFEFMERYSLELSVDVFNVFDNQTRRNIDPEVHRASFGQARSLWNPRTFRLNARFQF